MTPAKPTTSFSQTGAAPAPKTAFETSFRQYFLNAPATNPVIESLQQRALASLELAGFPTRRQEEWKYLQLAPVLNQAFEPFQKAAAMPDVSAHQLPESNGARLVFVNGQFASELSDTSAMPAGVTLCDLQSALNNNAELLEPMLLQSVAMDKDAFSLLNTATLQQGVFFHIPADTTVDVPVQVLLVTTPGSVPQAAMLRQMVVAEANAKATLALQTVSLVSKNDVMTFSHMIQDVVAKENAQLNLSYVQLEDKAAWQFSNTRVWLSQASNVALTHIDLGASVARHSVEVAFSAETAHCELNGLNVLKEKTQVYHHVVMDHATPNNTSEQFYKSILDDQTRSEFNGTVKVGLDANGTDSKQLTKNLLLSEDAHAFARPQLQILADDVKCNHGATVGQLDKNQLFYMKSRGIEPELAETLLMYGFAEELIQKLPVPSLRQYVDERLLSQLNQIDNPLASKK